MFTDKLRSNARRLLTLCAEKNIIVATAESCTGGLIAAVLTEIPGSSAVFDCGYVTYSNATKHRQLGVPAQLIKAEGAVSATVAKAMAEGALKRSKADIAVAVTGIAGPTGGTDKKPVGLVYIAIAAKTGKTQATEYRFKGDRTRVRLGAVEKALGLLRERLSRFS